jgi:hypothetical protein
MKHRPTLFALLMTLALPLAAEDKKTTADFTLKPGCTLMEFVDQLRPLTEQNIVLATEVELLPVPSMALKNVSPESILRTVDAMLPDIEVVTTGTPPEPVIVTIQPASRKSSTTNERRVTHVFKLRTSSMKPDQFDDFFRTIQDVAFMALEADHQQRNSDKKEIDMPRIQTHTQTGLVIVSGRESSVRLVLDVISAIDNESVLNDKPATQGALKSEAVADKAKPASEPVSLRYVEAASAMKALKATLGETASQAVAKVDEATNSITVNEDTATGRHIKSLLRQLDERPLTYTIHTIINKNDANGKGHTVSAPKVITVAGHPATIGFADYEVELMVEPGPLDSHQLNQANRQLEQARKALEEATAARQKAMQKVEAAIRQSQAQNAQDGPKTAAPCKTNCFECHASPIAPSKPATNAAPVPPVAPVTPAVPKK